MFRSIPSPNRVLNKKWRKIEMDQLKCRLETAKPRVETQQGFHTYRGPPKLRKERSYIYRCQQIERDNKILLEKMAKIMRPSGSTKRSTRRTIVTGVYDFKNFNNRKKSLNRENRKNDLIRVTLENQVFQDNYQRKIGISETYNQT